MKMIISLLLLFIDINDTEPKSLTPLEREKQSALLMLFPF